MRRLATLAIVVAAAALTAAGQAFTITTTSLPPATVGQPYGPIELDTAGDPGPISWTFASGGGPPGSFIVGAASIPVGQPNTTGTLCWGFSSSGVPSCASNVSVPPSVYPIIIQATSLTTGRVASMQYSLSVLGALQIATTQLKNGFANQLYSDQLQGLGGSGPSNYVWSIVNGSLPPGITLDAFKGSLLGTAPAINAVYPFTVQLTDQLTQMSVTQALSITVTGGLAILTSTLPDAIVRQAYSFQLQATGSSFLVWSVLSGTLPPGFTLSADGVLSGFPINPGQFQFRVQVTNPQSEGTLTANQLYVLSITLGPLGIDCALCTEANAFPNVTQNVPFSVALTPLGGIPPYTWSFGTPLPQGLTIDRNSGIISGTVTSAAGFQVPVILTDSVGKTFSKTFNLRVNTAVSITTPSLPNGSTGVTYSANVLATGGSFPFQWSVSDGALPPGLTLTTVNSVGQISGVPTADGTYSFTLQVSDFFGSKATKAYTVVIGPVLTITTSSLPDGVLGQPYSQPLTAAAGSGALAWTIASGTLPPGLTLDGTAGIISGTPFSSGTFSFDVLVTDAAKATARRTLTIKIPLLISPATVTGLVLANLSQQLTATGGTAPYTWSSGTLPPGLQLSTAGVISGTPGVAGTSQVVVNVTDSAGLTGSKTITITINQPPPPATTIITTTATQPAVSITTGAPYASEITGVLTLAFAPASGITGTDQMVRFSDGSTSLQFIVRANQTTAIFPTVTGTPAIIKGTVAGTITLTARLSAGGQDVTPSPAPTTTIVIDAAVPAINSVTLQQVTGGLNVVVTGSSNTREVSSGSFSFTITGSSTPVQVTVQLTSAYAAWFGSSASNATGGQFKLNVPFSVTQGTATAVTKVSVTLTNSKGTSASVSSP